MAKRMALATAIASESLFLTVFRLRSFSAVLIRKALRKLDCIGFGELTKDARRRPRHLDRQYG